MIRDVVREVMIDFAPKIAGEVHRRLRTGRTSGMQRAQESSLPPQVPSFAELVALVREQGSDALEQRLAIPAPVLRAAVAQWGFDPSRVVRRWKDEDRLRKFVRDEIVRRAFRSEVFAGPDQERLKE